MVGQTWEPGTWDLESTTSYLQKRMGKNCRNCKLGDRLAHPQDEGRLRNKHRSHRSGIFRSSHRRKSRRDDVHTATIPRVVERQWEELHKSQCFRVRVSLAHAPTHSTPLHSQSLHVPSSVQCSLMSLCRHDLVTLSKIFVQRLSHTLPATPKNCTYLGWCGCVHH